MVQMTPVEGSKSISAIGYDHNSRELSIRYASSSYVYTYQDVPAEVWQQIEAAESIGAAVGKLVRGRYEATMTEQEGA